MTQDSLLQNQRPKTKVADMQSPEKFENLLQEHFHLRSFRRGQKEIISDVLAKKDVLAVLPTGGGKSLCYQFPALLLGQLTVVISPLIALMRDQVAALRKIGIAAGCLHAGQNEEEKRKIFQDISLGGPYLLYLSPERVQKEGFKNWIKARPVSLFAVDEAHCVSQWGHDFREEYGQLSLLKALRPDVPVLALTASATPTVLADIAKQLSLKNPEQRVHGFYRPNLYYQVEICADDDAKLLLLMQSLKQTPTGRVIIYCGTRKVTEELAQFLASKFDQVGYYHAGLANEQRNQVQEAYTRGHLRILVATNAFGMGIDQPDVRLVVHYQMPANIDSLYQEMGRAGRDGEHSTCLLLYAKKDKGLQSFFITGSEAQQEIKNLRWRNLEALVNYSEGGECRHSEILTYFKDSQRVDRCGHCDACDPESSRRIQKPAPPPAEAFTSVIKSVKAKMKKAPAKGGDLVLSEEEQVRFEGLKRWRKEKAKELDVPAFVVFSDQSLKHMAQKNPQNLDELRRIYGVGDAKLEQYGWDVLAELGASR
ncbi:RecQ family ATP-dependent DNA helicase [Bdellovibrio sp. HCB2-146]|uniref:RecQ family ATP-dependent DNA helicase n=1 Tax=Bdellovibrio sp. HCB2-146 TaxID=3394362 RepID=UPI0039BC5060